MVIGRWKQDGELFGRDGEQVCVCPLSNKWLLIEGCQTDGPKIDDLQVVRFMANMVGVGRLIRKQASR